MFGWIDRWIDRLDGIEPIPLTDEQSLQLLASNLSLRVPEDVKNKILLTGTADFGRIEEIKASLSQQLPHISFFCCGNIEGSPEGAAQLGTCTGILLVEQRNRSTYPGIEKEIKYFQEIGKTILGFVMV